MVVNDVASSSSKSRSSVASGTNNNSNSGNSNDIGGDDDKHSHPYHSSTSSLPHHTTDPVDIYCSFDAQPPPNISWYFISYNNNNNNQQQNLSSSTFFRPQLITTTIADMYYYYYQSQSPFYPSNNNDNKNNNNYHHNNYYNSYHHHNHHNQANQYINQQQQQHHVRIVSLRHLRIVSPTIYDIGTYVCIANNSHFEVRHETELLLRSMIQVNLTVNHYNNHDHIVNQQQSTLPLIPGDSVILTCNLSLNLNNNLNYNGDNHNFNSIFQVLNSRFIITYQWYHNLIPVTNLEESFAFSSSASSSSSASANSASSVNKNRGYFSSSSSKKNFHLNNDQHQQMSTTTNEKNMLRIRDLDYPDGGIYQCFVRLSGPDYQEVLQASTIITLKRSPPSLVNTFNEQVLIADGELSLKCVATGIPLPTIIWQRNGQNLTDYMGNLIVANSQLNNGNSYRYKTVAIEYNNKRFQQQHNSRSTTSSSSSATSIKDILEQIGEKISYFNISNIKPQVCSFVPFFDYCNNIVFYKSIFF